MPTKANLGGASTSSAKPGRDKPGHQSNKEVAKWASGGEGQYGPTEGLIRECRESRSRSNQDARLETSNSHVSSASRPTLRLNTDVAQSPSSVPKLITPIGYQGIGGVDSDGPCTRQPHAARRSTKEKIEAYRTQKLSGPDDWHIVELEPHRQAQQPQARQEQRGILESFICGCGGRRERN